MDVFRWSSEWAKAKGLFYEAYDELKSTNLSARDKALTDPPFKLYLAGFQTHGRGRGKKVWQSPKQNSGFLASFSFSAVKTPPYILPLLIGLHLWESVQFCFPHKSIKLKLPNDLYFSEKKIGGLLIEAVQGRLIIGLGLNISSSPSGLSSSGFLLQEGGLMTKELWFQFLNRLYKWPVEEKTLQLKVRNKIKKAIKHFSYTPLLDITSSGDLIFKDKKVLWHEL